MSAVAPLFACLCLATALVTAWILVRYFGQPEHAGRVSTIDCLRGYLALFVFFHHSAVWYFYLRTGRWELPPSNLYTHLGQSSVGVFFMITGFLFFSKLLDARQRPINWGHLFVSRLARLVPLYIFAMLALFSIVAVLSHGKLNTSMSDLLASCFRWLSFTILGAPDINGVTNTAVITAGVTWSLTYEWLLYLSLPAIALLLPKVGRVPPMYLLFSVFAVGGAIALSLPAMPLVAFLAGFVSAIFARSRFAPTVATSRLAAILACTCIFCTVTLYPQPYTLKPMALLSVAFSIIACGNRLFGALASAACKLLGDASYSIYLLHGTILFCAFTFMVGATRAASLPTYQHWLVCILCTPLLVLLSFATYRLVEVPAIKRVKLFLDRPGQ